MNDFCLVGLREDTQFEAADLLEVGFKVIYVKTIPEIPPDTSVVIAYYPKHLCLEGLEGFLQQPKRPLVVVVVDPIPTVRRNPRFTDYLQKARWDHERSHRYWQQNGAETVDWNELSINKCRELLKKGEENENPYR